MVFGIAEEDSTLYQNLDIAEEASTLYQNLDIQLCTFARPIIWNLGNLGNEKQLDPIGCLSGGMYALCKSLRISIM